ncbi:MAG: hypothetical protein QOH33_1178 [Paraburkholderia sp.]|nr:hypothetical protein [Paraburkholderia sp.]
MRTLKAAQSNHFFPASVAVAATAGREEPDTGEQRRFRALFDEASPPEDSPCARPGEQHDQCRDVASSASHEDGEPINCENNFNSLAPSRRFDIDELKVRLTNGPLAGSEVEAYRCGDQVSVHIRAAGSTPLQGIERPSAAKLAAELSMRLGLPVSVEYRDAPAAAT